MRPDKVVSRPLAISFSPFQKCILKADARLAASDHDGAFDNPRFHIPWLPRACTHEFDRRGLIMSALVHLADHKSDIVTCPLSAMRRSQLGERGRHEAAKRRVHLGTLVTISMGKISRMICRH
jgi:hypothetical protein